MAEAGRIAQILARAADRPGGGDLPRRLCLGCCEALGSEGAAIALTAAAGQPVGLWASGDTVEAVERAQFSLGDGPSVQAFSRSVPLLVPDLATQVRWPMLTAAVPGMVRRLRTVLSCSLRLSDARVGTLSFYWSGPAAVDDAIFPRAETAAAVVAAVLGAAAEQQTGSAPTWLEDALQDTTEVYQAVGMVRVQLGLSKEQALAFLRAYAFAHDSELAEVAGHVVRRRLRFTPDEWGEGPRPHR